MNKVKGDNKAIEDFERAGNLIFDSTGQLIEPLQGLYKVSLYNCPDIPGHHKILGPSGGYNTIRLKLPFMKNYSGLFFTYVNWEKFTKFDYDLMENPEPVRKFFDEVKLLRTDQPTIIGQMKTKKEDFVFFYLTRIGSIDR